jgi:hypothetical protein
MVVATDESTVALTVALMAPQWGLLMVASTVQRWVALTVERMVQTWVAPMGYQMAAQLAVTTAAMTVAL